MNESHKYIAPRLKVKDWLRVQTMLIALESTHLFKVQGQAARRSLRGTRRRLVVAIEKARGPK